MGIILEFPHKERRNQIEVEKEIYTLAGHLKDLYDAIRKVELGQEQLKKQACDMEDTYQTLIQLYGEIVGNENVPADMLEYAIFVGMTRDPKRVKSRLPLNHHHQTEQHNGSTKLRFIDSFSTKTRGSNSSS